jgi:hypothetical protein
MRVVRSLKKERDKPDPVIELTLDASLYERLKTLACARGISEDEELFHALRLGMDDFWRYFGRYERQWYRSLQKIFAQAKRDGELLQALIEQNIRMRNILDEHKRPQGERQR